MQITERSTLSRPFERRLRAALDRIVPPTPHFAGARYRSMILPGRSGRIWRLAPALVGIGAIGIMATSATVATGSTNPAVWTQRAASTIKSVSHIAQSKPGPVQSPKPKPSQGAASSQPSGAGHPTNSSGGERHLSRHERSGQLLRPWESPKPKFSYDRSSGDHADLFRDAYPRIGHRWRPNGFRLWPA
jgi:hypothetical protein